MKNIVFYVIALLLFAAELCIAQQPATVKVEGGLLQGTSEEDLTVYKGIPFAAPPVGELRWCAPHPAANWEGVKQATEFSPGPVQGGNPPSGQSFSDTNPVVMYFSQTPRMGPVPSAESLKSLDAYFQWRRTPEGEAWAK
jgi:hypothetical protein